MKARLLVTFPHAGLAGKAETASKEDLSHLGPPFTSSFYVVTWHFSNQLVQLRPLPPCNPCQVLLEIVQHVSAFSRKKEQEAKVQQAQRQDGVHAVVVRHPRGSQDARMRPSHNAPCLVHINESSTV